MDSLTQAALGAAVGEAVLGKKIGRKGAILGAIGGLGVYALVLQPLFTISVKLILVLLRSNWRPALKFQFNSIIGMFKYTLKFKASQILLYTDRNIDYLKACGIKECRNECQELYCPDVKVSEKIKRQKMQGMNLPCLPGGIPLRRY